MNKRKYKNYLWGYFFVAPTIIGLLILNIYPIFKTLLLSFSASTGFESSVWSDDFQIGRGTDEHRSRNGIS